MLVHTLRNLIPPGKRIFFKFGYFNIYYFFNNSSPALIHSIADVLTLLDTLETSESQYCDIAITKNLPLLR